MSLEDAPMMRFRHAVAIFSLCSAGAAVADAADRSISGTVTSAFETIVIDAKTAAAKATSAAKDALASEKTTRSKKARKDGEKTDTAGADKSSKSADKKAGGKGDSKQAAEPAKPDGTPAGANKATTDTKGATTTADGIKAGEQPAGKAAETAPKKPLIATEWPAVDVELARARCTQLLKGVDAVTVPEAPFRKGDCGTMAPVRLISIGKNPEVSLSPPAVITCDMVVALTKWMKEEVQPLARRHLGSEVIRMESMSDYSCRMAYGRVGNKLSEHGKANALDIRGFTTRKGDQAVVLADWGQTKRDVEKQIAAAKAAAAKAEAVKLAAEKASKERAEAAEVAAKSENTGSPLPRKTLIEGLPTKHLDPSLALPASVSKEGFGMAPTRLGGPKNAVETKVEIKPIEEKKQKGAKKDTAKKKQGKAEPETTAALPQPGAEDQPAVAPAPKSPTSKFLHEAHASACRIFGTTLGPEANEAHRNHFHVDMAERKVRKICD